MMAALDACDRRFFHEYILRLSSSVTSPDLHAGGAFARGIEVARRVLWEENLPLDAALARATVAFTKYWGDYEPPDNHPKTFRNTLCALYDYFEQYPPESDSVKPYMLAGDVPATEFSFAIITDVLHPDTNEPIFYCGRFDLLGYFHNDLYIVDEKTTKSLGPSWLQQWDMRGQFIGYCYAAQQYGLKVHKALIRGIAIQKTQYKHLQALVSYPQWQIERWWKTMNAKLQLAVDKHTSGRWLHSYGDACAAYGGCQFNTICQGSPDKFLNWADTYVERKWNPLKKDPTEEGEK